MADAGSGENNLCEDAVYSNEYLDFVFDIFGNFEKDNRLSVDICMESINQFQKLVHIKSNESVTAYLPRVGYHAIPKCYGLMDIGGMEASGVLRLRRLPYINLYGRNVLTAFIDTGIDYQHPVFLNADHTTRIVEIWDQTIREGTPPEGLTYGSLYDSAQINLALQSEEPYGIVPSRDEVGHGTFAAGIAAGNDDPANNFTGAAPQAGIIAVKLKPAKDNLKQFFGVNQDALCFQESDILMAIRYLVAAAARLNKPIIIYMGVGTNSGNHSGDTIVEQQFYSFGAINGIGLVTATGNEANQRHHYFGNLETGQYKDVEIQVGEGEKSFVTELWVNVPLIFSVGFISPSGEVVEKVGAGLGARDVVRFLFENTKIYVNYEILSGASDDELIFMRFETPAPGLWKIRVYNDESFGGNFNMWLPMAGFISPNTFFTSSDPYITICSPGNGQRIITTASYNYRNNSISIDSGRGYTQRGLIKPTAAAPGVDIYGPVPGGGFANKSGSSIAGAFAAGICALLMEWGIIDGNQPGMDTRELNRLITVGSKRLPGIVYPNREFGYGILDIMQIFESIRMII